jgi:GAF domain-containing protein
VRARIDAGALAASVRRLEAQAGGLVLADSLQRVIDACVQVFPVDGSGIMLADEQGVLRYAVASDGPGRHLEQVQIDVAEGPCVDTYVADAPVNTGDLVGDARWPALGPRMAGRGVGAVLGVPVHLSGLCVGSLDVYRRSAREWDTSEGEALQRYGHVVEAMIAAALSAEQAGELADQLTYALDHRLPVERGIGYLMARDGLTQPQAFSSLRGAARSSRRKIGDVARHLLETGRLPGEAR